MTPTRGVGHQRIERNDVTHNLRADTFTITGHQGDEIEAYLAQPTDDVSGGSIVVIHHMPGYDEGTKEIARKFAANGYAALIPNLYHREAPGASPDDAAATARAAGGVPDDRLVGDVEGAMKHLQSLPASNGKVAVIGYCSGGRQSLLAGCRLPLNGVIDCYGAFVAVDPPAEYPVAAKGRQSQRAVARTLRCRRPIPFARTERDAARSPRRRGQGLYVSHLRGRRPRVLQR
jgi:carboxymethylenebutenolidase